jgi:uncharacterized protein YdaT
MMIQNDYSLSFPFLKYSLLLHSLSPCDWGKERSRAKEDNVNYIFIEIQTQRSMDPGNGKVDSEYAKRQKEVKMSLLQELENRKYDSEMTRDDDK